MRTASGTRSSALLLAVLVYVTLDLSLAVMPGAFVFDPGDSIESIHAARARTAAELPTLPGPARQGRRSFPTASVAPMPRASRGIGRPTTRPPRPKTRTKPSRAS